MPRTRAVFQDPASVAAAEVELELETDADGRAPEFVQDPAPSLEGRWKLIGVDQNGVANYRAWT